MELVNVSIHMYHSCSRLTLSNSESNKVRVSLSFKPIIANKHSYSLLIDYTDKGKKPKHISRIISWLLTELIHTLVLNYFKHKAGNCIFFFKRSYREMSEKLC